MRSFIFRLIQLFVVLSACAIFQVRANSDPIVPRSNIALFNGKDLSPFFSWLEGHGRADPDQVFTVEANVDGGPAIHITGNGFGGLITRESYSRYKLVAEYRWGERTWGKRAGKARDSGILLLCDGEPGNVRKDFTSPWMRSIEFQIIEGGTGDMLLVGGFDRGARLPSTPSLTSRVLPGTAVWNPVGASTAFTKGRVDWLHKDPAWKDVAGFRGRNDVQNPTGQWNRIEGICGDGHLVYYLNGVKINEATDVSLRSGRLLVQSEGAEVYYRRIELQPLSP